MNLDFETYLARHGEFGVQALIERLERYEGVHACAAISLEDRWNALMAPVAANGFGQQVFTA
jgi:hypothetical protein